MQLKKQFGSRSIYDLGVVPTNPVYCDNNGAIAQAK